MDYSPHRIAVVGAGLVGCSWAVIFAAKGRTVTVWDDSAAARAAVPARAEALLADMVSAGLAEDAHAALARITVAETLEAALEGAEYVQESVFERVDVKTPVAAAIGALIAPGTIVGSSSSGIPASAFTEGAPQRERFLVVHPINPPHVVPLVELVPAPWTDPDVPEMTRAFMLELGRVPVNLSREIEGFIVNRLQGALLNEARALLEDGIASTGDIDATIAHGLGLRWAFMGPFETIDLNAPGGVADYAARLAPLYQSIGASRSTPEAPWSPELIEKVTDERRAALPLDDLGARSNWRDRMLMGLVAHLAAARKAS